MVFIILTIYNEEKSIPTLIKDIRRFMKKGEYKIIAVDDGSYDNSLRLLQELSDEDIIIKNHKINLSIGAVFLTGFNAALDESKNNDDIVILMESDQTSEPRLLKRLIDKISIEGYDIAIASRFAKGGGYINFPLNRKIYSYFANFILRLFFPISKIRDYTIFYRSYRVGILREISNFFGLYNFIQCRSFVSNSELLIKAALFTDKITEIPYIYNYGNKKGKSKLHPIRNILEYIYFIFYNMRKLKKVIFLK